MPELQLNTECKQIRTNNPSALDKLAITCYIYGCRNNYSGLTDQIFEIDYAIKHSAYLLSTGSIGNFLYDTILEFCENRERPKKAFIDKLCKFVTEVEYNEFAREARKIINMTVDTDYKILLYRVLSIVLCLYSKEYIVSSGSDECITINGCFKPSILVSTVLATEQIRKESYIYQAKQNKTNKVTFTAIKNCLSNKETGTLLEKLKSRHSDVVSAVSDLSDSEAMDAFKYSFDQSVFSMIDALIYNYEQWKSYTVWPRYYVLVGYTKDANYYALQYYLNTEMIKDIEHDGFDCLKNRKVFLREKGVIIKLKSSLNGIESIYVSECHDNEEHLMKIIYEIPSMKHVHGFTLNMQDLRVSSLFGEYDYTVLLAVLYWLGVKTKCNNGDAYISQIMDYVKEKITEDNMQFEEPYSWNYTTSNTNKLIREEKAKAYKNITVGVYTRKLPDGEIASKKAIELAQKVFIELKPGYTIVDEFERKQLVNLEKK